MSDEVMTEQQVMKQVCQGWLKRAEELGLPKKGAKRAVDQQAYIEGALRALYSVGIITAERYHQIAFLSSIGRLDAYIENNSAA